MTSVAAQCMHALVTPGPLPDKEPMAAKKPTQFVFNSWCVLHELATRCEMSHVGGRASKAAGYLDELCTAICRGLASRRDTTCRARSALAALILCRTILCLSKHEPEGTPHEFLVVDTAIEQEAFGAFGVGHNDGADLFKIEMSSLVEKYLGYVKCWNGISGAPLDVKLLRAARAVEM